MNNRQKLDSFMLSGSVFLITSDGKTLSLPVPSQSPYDPLNWTWKKRTVALFPIVIFSLSCLVLTQGASLTYVGLSKEFSEEVCSIIVLGIWHHDELNLKSLASQTLHDRDIDYSTHSFHGLRASLLGSLDIRIRPEASLHPSIRPIAGRNSGCSGGNRLLDSFSLCLRSWVR